MYLNLTITEDNRDTYSKAIKESPKEENKERKNPKAKKEMDPGKFQQCCF